MQGAAQRVPFQKTVPLRVGRRGAALLIAFLVFPVAIHAGIRSRQAQAAGNVSAGARVGGKTTGYAKSGVYLALIIHEQLIITRISA